MQTYRNQIKTERKLRRVRALGIQLLVYALLDFSAPAFLSAAVFHVPDGDVPALIAAINAANSNGEENTIILEAGIYALTGGLPLVTSTQTVQGAGASTTIIERDNGAPFFPIFQVAFSGTLTLDQLKIQGAGEGILNQGKLTVAHSIIARDSGSTFGAGIFNAGTVIITHSTVTGNRSFGSGGGMYNAGGMVSIDNSAFTNNISDAGGGGLINDGGRITINNSTFARNSTQPVSGGILNVSGGEATITNSTISDNTGGISNGPGSKLELQNTIVALNTTRFSGPPRQSDCRGLVTSLGNNLIGDLTECSIALQVSDRTGDPGFGDFIDDGAPGNGRFPLLPGSQAVDAGNNGACPPMDQLGTPRNGPCDIGAVEFHPVVNDLVAVGTVSTDFDATPVSGGPAGTFHITADFTNTSNQAIVNAFTEVVELTGGNLLLNADGGAGGVGARLTVLDSATTPFQPGASSTLEFLIGLQTRETFTFFVNMLGESQTSSPFVTRR